MIRTQKVTGRTMSMPVGILIGTGISLLLTFLIAVLLSKLVSSEKVEWNQIGYGILITLLIASIAGGKTACSVIRRRKLLVCASVSVLFWLLLAMATALFFGGQYDGIGVTAMIILGGNCLVYIHELKKEGGRKSKNHRNRMKYNVGSAHGK